MRRDNEARRPKRVYEGRAWWCPECWRDDIAGAYDRFHSLYEVRHQHHVARGTSAFFPPHLRPDTTEEVISDTMRVIWEGWEGFVVPERVRYIIAYRMLLQRVPRENHPLMSPFSELSEILSDKEQRTQDDPLMGLEEQFFLDELIAERPEPQCSYVRERLLSISRLQLPAAGPAKSATSPA
ncbi:hypothetical protein [Streptomyces sp. NPDC001068]|uniref:hypothetical protein n=1 Tax=Streptomyces sp. NPDC001068 TaxID=3364544 RepID=UPI0036892952